MYASETEEIIRSLITQVKYYIFINSRKQIFL